MYEYFVWVDHAPVPDALVDVEELNKMGLERWKLVTVINNSLDNSRTFYFMRELLVLTEHQHRLEVESKRH